MSISFPMNEQLSFITMKLLICDHCNTGTIIVPYFQNTGSSILSRIGEKHMAFHFLKR